MVKYVDLAVCLRQDSSIRWCRIHYVTMRELILHRGVIWRAYGSLELSANRAIFRKECLEDACNECVLWPDFLPQRSSGRGYPSLGPIVIVGSTSGAGLRIGITGPSDWVDSMAEKFDVLIVGSGAP
jgi:hypothetical protein